jgi:hypothetical protein
MKLLKRSANLNVTEAARYSTQSDFAHSTYSGAFTGHSSSTNLAEQLGEADLLTMSQRFGMRRTSSRRNSWHIPAMHSG